MTGTQGSSPVARLRRVTGLKLWALLVGIALIAVACGTQSTSSAHAHEHGVLTAAGTVTTPGKTRTYYIAADPVQWDYAPSGINQITGQPFDDAANVFVGDGPDRIGKVYTKSLYREYTDATFATRKPRPPEWQHLGILGPTIQAEVGDTIKVVFKNNTPFPASIHPHGVFYTKANEGAPYSDGVAASLKPGDEVAPGDKYTYTWAVPDRAGPGPADGSSVMWMYHSHVDETGDTYSGLMGAMIITKKGMARADGSPIDVDRQIVNVFWVMDENQSLWIDKNMADHNVDPAVKDTDEFHESNLMHSINGYVYGNLPGQKMKVGDRVRWYEMGMGTEVDLHTPHWHGNTVTSMGMRTDVISLLPASMVMADMVPDNAGTWLFHCHVSDHILAGMMSKYTVTP